VYVPRESDRDISDGLAFRDESIWVHNERRSVIDEMEGGQPRRKSEFGLTQVKQCQNI
jgi:hypothetical protein